MMPAFRLRLHPLGEPLGRAAASDPADAGLAVDANGRDDKAALRLLQRAASLEPHDADYHFILGLGLARGGRHKEAVVAFREALSLHRADADYYYAYGSALWEVGNDEEAADAFREVLRLRPGDPWALNGLACALTRLGREPEAIALWHEALNETSADDLSGNLGIALWRKGETTQGMKSLRYAVSLAMPQSVHWLQQLALAYSALAQHDDAAAALRKVVDLRPGDAVVRVDLASALFDAGKLEAAEEALEEAVRLDSDMGAARARVQQIRSALQLKGLHTELRRRRRRRPSLPLFVVTFLDWVAALSMRRPVSAGFTVVLVMGCVYLGYRLVPPHVTRYLLLDDIAAVAIAPIDNDDDIRSRLANAVRSRGMEGYIGPDSCTIDTRPKWRRIVCRYEVPVVLLPGRTHLLRLKIDVEKPYLTQPETLNIGF